MNPAHAITGKKGAAFSLTEVVVALGVATVAIVSILGLFPVGFDTVRESAAETQAAILARTIANDLQAGVRERGFTNAIFVRGPNIMSSGDYLDINLQGSSTYVVGYRGTNYEFGVDSYRPWALQPRTNLSAATTVDASNDVVAELTIAPLPVSPTNPVRLAQATLRVSSPGSVALSNRMVQEFRWMVGP